MNIDEAIKQLKAHLGASSIKEPEKFSQALAISIQALMTIKAHRAGSMIPRAFQLPGESK